ncbi:MAG: nitroreductase family protein [Ruminiclostridium sp.]|nr:nitroreductase family protein [Ruminiclostridium sp.]
MDAIEAIMNRCSYRGRFEQTSVPRDDLVTIMKAGLAAPSGCNKQTVSLVAVDDAEVLKALLGVIDPPVAATAPAAICVLTQRIDAYRDKCFAVQDYSAAIENMLLAATALGYRSCWYEGHITDDDRICDKMAEMLNVPDGYELVCFLPIGRPAEKDIRAKKKDFEERARFNSFSDGII